MIPDGNGTFSAEILEFPGCFAQGATPNEAFRNLEEAAKSWIQATLDQGQDIPEPQMNQGFSGKIALRLPRSIHRMAARMADRDKVSLNQFLVSAISSRVGAEEMINRLSQRFATVGTVMVNASVNMNIFQEPIQVILENGSTGATNLPAGTVGRAIARR